jgi:hypothetical protein
VVKDFAEFTEPRWFISDVPSRRSRDEMMELCALILGAGGLPLADSRTRPERCPAGHPLENNQQRGWLYCWCVDEDSTGHRFWNCKTCGVTVYAPPHTPESDKAARTP